MGNGETSIRWNLVLNDNEYRPVESAYFEFNNKTFKYYEDGILKKEGTHRITFFDINENNAPLHLNLQFGTDDTGLSIYDYALDSEGAKAYVALTREVLNANSTEKFNG